MKRKLTFSLAVLFSVSCVLHAMHVDPAGLRCGILSAVMKPDSFDAKEIKNLIKEVPAEVKQCIEASANKGVESSILHCAAACGSPKILDMLLSTGVDPDLKKANCTYSFSPLGYIVGYCLIRQGKKELGLANAKILLEMGASPNLKFSPKGYVDYNTPFEFAVDCFCRKRNRDDSFRFVELFLEYGADPELQDAFGRSLLHKLASKDLNPKSFRRFLKFCPNIALDIQDNNGDTPLHCAVRHAAAQHAIGGRNRCVNILIEHGADYNKSNHNGETPLSIIGMHVDPAGLHGPILSAVMKSDSFAAEGIRNLVDVVSVDVKQCIEASANKGAQSRILHCAAACGSSEILDMLLSTGVDPDLKKADGTYSFSPLGCIVDSCLNRQGKKELGLANAKILLAKGVNPNLEFSSNGHADYNTPFEYAVDCFCRKSNCDDSFRFVELFLNFGADPELQDASGRSLLHKLASKDLNPESFRRFLTCCPNIAIDIQDNRGNAPLHYAVRHAAEQYGKKNYSCVDILVKHGADCNKPNNEGETPLSMAEKQNCSDLINILEKNKKRSFFERLFNGIARPFRYARQKVSNLRNYIPTMTRIKIGLLEVFVKMVRINRVFSLRR